MPSSRGGLLVAPPDYVGIGCQRCGTTWWNDLIECHPEVFQVEDREKEVHFFDQFGGRSVSDEELAVYARYFPRPRGSITGEWSPRYLYDFWTPALLRRAAPDARILVMLRDPVDRFRSGLTRHRRWGGDLRPSTVQQAYERGLYAVQIENLLAHFPAEQCLFLQYEACRADPLPALARTYAFLGLDPTFTPDHGVAPSRRPDEVVIDDEQTSVLRAAYRSDALRLGEMLPDLDLSLWRSLGVDASSTFLRDNAVDRTRP
jgi:hypothetical protein